MRSLLKTLIIAMSALMLLFAGVATAQNEPQGEVVTDPGLIEFARGICESGGGVWQESDVYYDDVLRNHCEGAYSSPDLPADQSPVPADEPEPVTPAAPASPTPAAPTFTG